MSSNELQKEDGKKHDFFHDSGIRFGGRLLDRRVHGWCREAEHRAYHRG